MKQPVAYGSRRMALSPVSMLGAALVSALATAPAWAAPEPFSCPTELPSTLQRTSSVPDGFTATQQSAQHVLTAFRLNEGPLDKRAGAIYDDVKTERDAKGNVTERLIWSVPTTPGSLAICGYSSTSVVLTHPLDGYKQCTAVSRKVKGGVFEMQSASCR